MYGRTRPASRRVGGTTKDAIAAAPPPIAAAATSTSDVHRATLRLGNTRSSPCSPAESTEHDDTDRRQRGGEQHGHHAAARAVEVPECAGSGSERDEHEPRHHDDRTRVDAHLEPFGLELVEQLQILGRRVDEVFEDRADDAPAALVGEDQHFEHAVARRVGELLLHDLERGPGSDDTRELREAGERVAEGRRAARRAAR